MYQITSKSFFFFKKETHTKKREMSYNTKTIEMFGFVWMARE